jgi:hypothetical protein
MNFQSPTARNIAERGIAIYRRKYLADFERQSPGRFAAIYIDSEQAYVADYPEQALAEAKHAAPKGLFYLIRVGSLAAFRSRRRVVNSSQRDAGFDRIKGRADAGSFLST